MLSATDRRHSSDYALEFDTCNPGRPDSPRNQPVCGETFPAPESCYEGAQRYTQPFDIAWALSQVTEEGLDMHSQAVLLQADVRQYYDSMHVVRIARWLVQSGFGASWAAAAARVQMLPSLRRHGHWNAQLRLRSKIESHWLSLCRCSRSRAYA